MITDKQFKDWIDALRFGGFVQGTGQLKSRENRYCCLGVFCEIEGFDLESTIPGSYVWRRWGSTGGIGSIGESDSRIADPLKNIKVHLRQELARINDSGRSFTTIADHLEEHRQEFVE